MRGRPVRSLGTALRRHWLMSLGALLATAGLVLGLALISDPVYRSSAKVLIADRDLGSVVSGVDQAADTGQSLATEAQIAGLPSVIAAAKLSLGDASSPTARRATVGLRVVTTPNTNSESNVLSIEANSGDRAYSSRLATAAAEQYVAFRKSIATRDVRAARDELAQRLRELAAEGRANSRLSDQLSARLQQLDTLLILGSARASLLERGAPATQVEPRPVRSLVLGLAGGLLIACIVAMVMEGLDRRVRSAEEAAEILATPILGQLPDPARKDRLPSVPVLTDPDGAAAEAFRGLRAHVKLGLASRRVRSILVMSAQPGEGKSYVAANLALSAAAAGDDVIAVDLDLRRPSLARYLGVADGPGLADLVAGDAGLDEAIVEVPLPPPAGGRLRLLRGGRRVPSPGEFVASQGLHEELERVLALGAAMVIVDTPPLIPVSDATALATRVDASIAVVDMKATSRRTLGRLRALLDAGAHRPLGAILTNSWTRRRGYAYGYGYEAPPASSARSASAAPAPDEGDLFTRRPA